MNSPRDHPFAGGRSPTRHKRCSVTVLGDSSAVAHEAEETDVIGVDGPDGEEHVYRVVLPRAGGRLSRHSSLSGVSDAAAAAAAHVKLSAFVHGGDTDSVDVSGPPNEMHTHVNPSAILRHSRRHSTSSTNAQSGAFYRGDGIEEFGGASSASAQGTPGLRSLASSRCGVRSPSLQPGVPVVESVGVSSPEMAEYFAVHSSFSGPLTSPPRERGPVTVSLPSSLAEAALPGRGEAVRGGGHSAAIVRAFEEQSVAIAELLRTVRQLAAQNARLEERMRALEQRNGAQAGKTPSPTPSPRTSGENVAAALTPTREPSKAPGH